MMWAGGLGAEGKHKQRKEGCKHESALDRGSEGWARWDSQLGQKENEEGGWNPL